MHPPDCPAWEYSNHPESQGVLQREVKAALVALVSGELDTLVTAFDSRPVHRRLFRRLTPPNFEYYAGHYRGEAFRCLRSYSVTVQSDPRVGAPPQGVDFLVRQLTAEL